MISVFLVCCGYRLIATILNHKKIRKVILTVIVTVGFSMFASANTIDIEENISKEQKTIVQQEKEVNNVNNRTTPTECENIRVLYYNHLVSQGVPQTEASGRAYSIYFQCKG